MARFTRNGCKAIDFSLTINGKINIMNDPKTLLRTLFEIAIQTVHPKLCVPPYLPPPPRGKLVVVGAGKASAAMAAAIEQGIKQYWPPERQADCTGLIVTRYGHEVPCDHIEIIGASHPVPDVQGQQAAQRIAALVQAADVGDHILCLISGGGSALLTLPAPGLTLADKQEVTTALLRCGASIHEINCVRKHLSSIKGGRLARLASPAQLTSLVISDVPGDDLTTIASGPTVPDPTYATEAQAILVKYSITPPPAIETLLRQPQGETPKPGDLCFNACETKLIATPQMALQAAADHARKAGYELLMLGDRIEGESHLVAKDHAKLARQIFTQGKPTVILSGGETVVTIKGDGDGGPNTEYMLALAVALEGHPAIYALAGDTDGIDGSRDNAGALITPDTLARAIILDESATDKLANNDSYGFFSTLGDLLISGPTHTNVNDFRAILINHR